MAASGGGGARVSLPSARLAQAEAVVGDWVLEFACYCLCRHFHEGRTAEFRRCRDVAQAVINNLSKIATHQKKTVYVCQFLTRIAKGKRLDCHFENDESISPLESALSVWTLLEREESKLDKLHEDIRRLIQIQVVAVHMEKGYFKEAAEVLERLFTDLESNKPLKMKLATIIKSKDPYVPFLQNFSYDLMISKIKNYVELFMKDNEANFLIQAATKQVEAKELEATVLQNETVNVSAANEEINLEASQSFMEELSTTNQSTESERKPTVRAHSVGKHRKRNALQSSSGENKLKRLSDSWRGKMMCKIPKTRMLMPNFPGLDSLKNIEKHGHAWACGRKRQRWTYEEDMQLISGVREFGVGSWAKILVHGDFNNRTGVMLKDRWRTLSRTDQV